MTTKTHKKRLPAVRIITAAEGKKLFNRQAKRYLNMSGKKFIAKWDSGGFNGTSERPEVMSVAMLLPLAR